MDEQEIKQYEMAAKLGITPPYLSDILNGRRVGEKAKIHIENMLKILKAERENE